LHSVSGDFGYFAEAGARTSFYNFMGYPSLFRDGKDIWTGSSPNDWDDSIVARMAKPSPMTLTLTGSYDDVSNTGTITAAYRNDSSASITARFYFVITEDSLYHLDPNGHAWHNHMARDFLPDQTGELVTVAAGATATRTRNFTISSAWNENRCAIATWFQRDAASYDVLQSGHVNIMNLVGVDEGKSTAADMPFARQINNPCSRSARFIIHVLERSEYAVSFYDIAGCRLRMLKGVASPGDNDVSWDLRDTNGDRVSAGIYLYRITNPNIHKTGKIIVR
jgi:hypothetical protein